VPTEKETSKPVSFLQALDESTTILKKARRNRHSLTGAGYYARSYWEKVSELRREGELLAQELERADRSEQSHLLRAALANLTPGDGSFADAESQLNRVRALWYTAIQLNLRATRAQRKVATHFLPLELRADIPGSIKTAFDQIQGCYAFEFWDAALVMLRKLVESLVIEGYEIAGRGAEIKLNGNYLAFGDLVGKAKSGSLFRLSRDSKSAIDTVKTLGDNAAHNPRFSGSRSDLDGLRNGARILLQDLLNNIKGFQKAASLMTSTSIAV
jgi:hypothetical protein